MSDLDELSSELKGSGGAKTEQKTIDSKSYSAMKESKKERLSPATKLGQSTPANLHRSVV